MLGRMTDAALNAPTLEASSLEATVQQGWQDHAKDAAGVLARLPGAVDLVRTPAHATSLAGLVVHVAGEHLGLWDEGIRLVERLRGLSLGDDPTAAQRFQEAQAEGLDPMKNLGGWPPLPLLAFHS